MIGDLVQQGVTQNDFSVTGSLLVGATIALMTVVVSYTSPLSPASRARRRARDRGRGRGRSTATCAGTGSRAQGARGGRAPEPDRVDRRRQVGGAGDRTASSASSRSRPRRLRGLPLYLTEADVAGLITAAGAVPGRGRASCGLAAGSVENDRGGGFRSTRAASRSCPPSTASSATRA